jgi:5-formyltetrahydrofolate cyclo-ligase
MPTKIPDSKNALRHQVQAVLKKMSLTERAAASTQVCSRLKQQVAWKRGKLILFFAPLPQEVDVWPLLAEALSAGKKIALPRFDPTANAYAACQVENPGCNLVIGKFGIREPASHCALISPPTVDLILVPGVAFDLNGRRLGRGRGFYDRLLVSLRGVKCGVAFDQQVVSELPVEPHDVRLDCLVTPTRWVEFRAAPISRATD